MILVSGGSGLVGSYLLIELIEKGEKVRAIFRSENSLEKVKKVFSMLGKEKIYDKIEWVQANLLDLSSLEDAFEGVEKVYHCAAIVSFQKGDANDLITTNIQGTANMVNLALQNQIKKFCFVSSVAALGKYRNGDCADENTLWQKEEHTSDYSISKFYSENEVWRASEEGLEVVIVNPSTIIGYGDWNQSSNSIFKRMNEGLPFYPSGSTGFVAVEDVVSSMIQLMESNISNERFVVSAENIEFKQLFEWISISLHKKAPSVRLKKWQAMAYASVMGILSIFSSSPPRITQSNIHSAFNKRCFSSKKLKEALGFEYRSIENSIQKNGELYRKTY